jgi:hypothetical protein
MLHATSAAGSTVIPSSSPASRTAACRGVSLARYPSPVRGFSTLPPGSSQYPPRWAPCGRLVSSTSHPLTPRRTSASSATSMASSLVRFSSGRWSIAAIAGGDTLTQLFAQTRLTVFLPKWPFGPLTRPPKRRYCVGTTQTSAKQPSAFWPWRAAVRTCRSIRTADFLLLHRSAMALATLLPSAVRDRRRTRMHGLSCCKSIGWQFVHRVFCTEQAR